MEQDINSSCDSLHRTGQLCSKWSAGTHSPADSLAPQPSSALSRGENHSELDVHSKVKI